MRPTPEYVTIVTPTCVPGMRGRGSTTPPYGKITTFRIPGEVQQDIDKARALIDPLLTRDAFIRLAVGRVAREVLEHHDRYLAVLRKLNDDD